MNGECDFRFVCKCVHIRKLPTGVSFATLF